MSISRWLGGEDAAPALCLSTSRSPSAPLSYSQLRERVESFELPSTGIVQAHSDDAETVLVSVLAALHTRRPVLVSDPATPPLALRDAPPSTGLILMTSGSSGIARAVARTSDSWHDSFAPFTQAAGLSSADSVALTGPLHVSMHLFAALHTLWLGAELCAEPGAASAAHCTPSALGRLLSGHALPRRLIVAGATLPAALRDTARQRGSFVTEYYGAAELSFVAITDTSGTLRAFPGVEIELRGGDIAEPGHAATLWARSPYVALGYAEIASEISSPGALLQDADGFASVGDLAELCTSGELRVRGRGDSAVTTAGSTVLSEGIERALETLPNVSAAAVLAEAHAVLGEIVVAVIEAEPSFSGEGGVITTPVAAARVLSSVRSASTTLLAPVERPRRWLLVESLPRTASGKLAKGVLRAGLASGTLPYYELGVLADV